MKKIIVAVLFLSLSACAQMQRQQAHQAASARNAICASAGNDPRLDSIRAKIPMDARNATLEQLNDPSMPTAEQKTALAAIPDVFSQCTNATMEFLDKYSAQGASVVYGLFIQDTKLLASGLWAEKLNFGQFNTARLKLDAQARTGISKLEQHAYDVARAEEMQRAQNAAILAPYFLQAAQPTYIAPSAPTNTNCYRYGNQVSCRSF